MELNNSPLCLMHKFSMFYLILHCCGSQNVMLKESTKEKSLEIINSIFMLNSTVPKKNT